MKNNNNANEKKEDGLLVNSEQDNRTKRSGQLNRHYQYTDQEIEQLYNQPKLNQPKKITHEYR